MGLLDRFKKLFETPTRLDVSSRFQLDRQSATGTMSTFRVAAEITTGRKLGLKLLDKEKLAHFESRFSGLKKPSEGEIAKKIIHENVVTTLDYGFTTSGQSFVLMEYIDGYGLDLLINQKNQTFVENRLDLLRQMGRAVQAVHDAGFIHRDICPRNFITNRNIDHIKLIDFGLTVPDQPEFRQPGNRTGTPQYMAPEIVRRRATDLRVDVFAYGVTAYRMLSFEHPWGSTDTTGVGALAHDNRQPNDLLTLRPDLNPHLAAAIHRCIEPDPGKRPKSIKHFLALIKDIPREDTPA